MELEIEIEEIEDCVILRLDVRLDATTTPLLEMKLNLSMTKKLSVQKGALALFSLDEDVMSVIKMAGFEKIFHIFPNEQDVLQYAAQL